MRHVFIPDVHGTILWEEIIGANKGSTFVFVGDYLDSWYASGKDQLSNFKDILQYKRDNPSTVLLIGNHDWHYVTACQQQYSGFQRNRYVAFNQEMEAAIKDGLLQMCFQVDDVVATHAGISKTWYNDVHNMGDIAMNINGHFMSRPSDFNILPSAEDQNSGNDVWQSPIWIRPESLNQDKLRKYRQVVGHTRHNELVHTDGIYYIDGIEKHHTYISLEDGVFTENKI